MNLTPQNEPRTKWDMNRILTFDIEAYDWTNPVAIGMYYGLRDSYETFTGDNCIPDFVDEILRRKHRNHFFVAHNGGNYDFIPIIEELADRNISLNIITRGSNDTPFFVQIDPMKDSEGNVLRESEIHEPRYLQDSFALMPRSLDMLTSSFAPNFEKLDYDVDNIEAWNDMDSQERKKMMKYLRRDCESLYKVLERFTQLCLKITDGTVPPQLTMGSTAMTAYRAYFMPDNLTIKNCYKPDNKVNPEEKVRESYFGGRTEVYKKYGENLNHYDVNSLYPYCYTRKPIPIGNVGHTGEHFPIEDENLGGILKIRGYVPPKACNGIPVLPKRITSDKFDQERVVFPAGEIEGWYMAKEVRYALEVGALTELEILDSYSSEYGYPFKDYGESFFQEKREVDAEKNPGLYILVKLFLNSFYGKFGMDREHKSVVKGPVSQEFQEDKIMINDRLANKGIMMEESESQAAYIIPRIASAITSQARIEMHKWFMKVFERGGDIWYCDTDSIVTDVSLPEGEDLGEMDLEGELEKSVFLAPKVYAEKYHDGDTLVKAKGMRNPDIPFETFEKSLREDEPSMINTSWETPRGFKAGMKQGTDSWFEKVEQERSLRQFDQKREYDGWDSKPIVL